MKILVTGATGFVGQHVVRWLVNHGYSVTATGTSIEKAKAFDWFDKVTFIPCDYFAEVSVISSGQLMARVGSLKRSPASASGE